LNEPLFPAGMRIMVRKRVSCTVTRITLHRIRMRISGLS